MITSISQMEDLKLEKVKWYAKVEWFDQGKELEFSPTPKPCQVLFILPEYLLEYVCLCEYVKRIFLF